MVQVSVHASMEAALRALKKKMQREGIFRELKCRRYHEKACEKKKRVAAECLRRKHKLKKRRQNG